MVDLKVCYEEEDLFPKIFTLFEERPYGVLFYNPDNRDSFDSNHAVIYKEKITDLKATLEDVVSFYKEKGLRPIIYQSMLDDAWFEDIKDELTAAGFKSWGETQRYMLPLGENKIVPNPAIKVRKIEKWDDSVTNVFLEAEEPWEVAVAKKSMDNPNQWMFAAYLGDKPIGLLYGHVNEKVCRGDYLLVSKKHRGIGAGRALFYAFTEWVKESGIENTYIWPDGDTPARIYLEGGYRFVEDRTAGRAVYEG